MARLFLLTISRDSRPAEAAAGPVDKKNDIPGKIIGFVNEPLESIEHDRVCGNTVRPAGQRC